MYYILHEGLDGIPTWETWHSEDAMQERVNQLVAEYHMHVEEIHVFPASAEID